MLQPHRIEVGTDEWLSEDATTAEHEREADAREALARSLGELVRAAASVESVLVVARGPLLPTGVLVGADAGRSLDPSVLAGLLTSAHDDRLALERCRLILGETDTTELAVARDRTGAICGIIAARVRERIPSSWLHLVLARAADSLAGWISTETPWPPQALLEAIEEPVIVHEAGFVLAANTAAARLIGRSLGDIAGMPISRITHRFTPLRGCSLVLGGRLRSALILDGLSQRTTETCVLDVVDRVIASRYAFLRQTARLAIEKRDRTIARAAASAVEQLVTLGLLDTASVFVAPSPANLISISVEQMGSNVVIEFVATGSIVSARGMDYLGTVICASHARRFGGVHSVDTSHFDRRVLRISLPAV